MARIKFSQNANPHFGRFNLENEEMNTINARKHRRTSSSRPNSRHPQSGKVNRKMDRRNPTQRHINKTKSGSRKSMRRKP